MSCLGGSPPLAGTAPSFAASCASCVPFGRPTTSVTTARRFSVWKGSVTSESDALASRRRARTWMKREAGLVAAPPSVTGVLQALQVVSGTSVSPLRVETSSAAARPFQWMCPKRARSPASRGLLVHVESGPPIDRTR